MVNVPERPIRKFNPGTFQSDGEVIEQFVVRKRECDTILEVLRDNIKSPSCQHTLITAPRGRGKTMLLARIAAEIRTKDEFSKHLMPVRFMEENQEIYGMADFWLETLFYLANESAAHDPAFATELRRTHGDLNRHWREQALEERSRAAVLEAADRSGKKLVLMVENLQSLENLDKDFGWKLRAILQSEPQIVLLASATTRFKGLDDASQPFFDLFRTVDLEPLTTEECGDLWQVISGDSVRGREIRPLEILTGGNPRLLVIIAGFAQHRSLRQLMEELVTLVDEHTEYFRGHLEVLPNTERRVYIAVLDLWQPSKPGEIADRARMDVRFVSTMLGRLIDRGAVIVEGSGKKRLYSASERLYSIYYKLRRERDEADIVKNLILFMTVFYNETERKEIMQMISLEMEDSPAILEGFYRAIPELPQFNSMYSGMTRTDNGQSERLLQEIIAALDGGALEKVIEIIDQLTALPEAPDSYVAIVLLIKGYIQTKLGDSEAAIAHYDEVVQRFGAKGTPYFQQEVASALTAKGILLGDLGDCEAAIAAYDDVVERFGASDVPYIQRRVADALFYKGNELRKVYDLEAAIATYEEIVERFGSSDIPYIQRQIAVALVTEGVLRWGLGDSEAAVTIYDEVIERFGRSDSPDIQWAVAWALSSKSMALIQNLHTDEALHICDELERRLGVYLTGDTEVKFRWQVLCLRTEALQLQGETQAALEVFRNAYATFKPDDETMIQEIIRIVPNLIAAGASEYNLAEILSGDRAKSVALEPLVIALRQNVGEAVRAPAEMLEVAEDIRNQISEKRLQKSARKEQTNRKGGK